MANPRDFYQGEHQNLFRGGHANKRPIPDLTEREAESILAECHALHFRSPKIKKTTNIKGEPMGYAVEFRDPNTGRFVLIGAWPNWIEHKRRLLEAMGLVMPS